LRRQNKSDSAFRYLDSAYSLAPQDVRTVAGLAELLIEKSDYANADTLLDYALSTDSLNITLLRLRVRDAYLAQHFDQAIMPGERLVRLQDPSVTPLTWLALSYYNLKLYTDCIRICDFMLSIGFDLESVYYYEAQAYAKLKNYSRSNELLSKALGKAISVTAEWYYDAQADNYEALKSYKKALACCDTSFYLFKNPITLYNAGRICENKLRELAMAKSYYRRYLAMARPKSETEKKAYIYVRRRWGSKALR
jgi:tetratricopeptide (TPR) repeat protein